MQTWQSKAIEANAKANTNISTYSTTDASSTAKEAKAHVKALKEVRKWNAKLACGQKKLTKLEKKIEKTQKKLDKLNKRIQFVNQ